jgi:hypothetical protein
MEFLRKRDKCRRKENGKQTEVTAFVLRKLNII